MTETTTTPKTRTITLTDRPPVRLREDEWPILATGSANLDDSDDRGNAPNRKWTRTIRVRRHADGRAIVYGVYDYETCYQGENRDSAKRGVLLPPSATTEAIIAAIRSIGAALAEAESTASTDEAQKDSRRWRAAVQATIADLPVEVI